MKFIVFILLSLFLVSCASIGNKHAVVNGVVGDYGIWEITDDSESYEWVSSRATTPTITENNVYTLVRNTSIVPLKKGITFGIDFNISGCEDGEWSYMFSLAHPEIIKPNGQVSTGYSGLRKLYCTNGNGDAVRTFSFDYEYEMAAGEWVFSIIHDGKTLAHHSFIIE